LPARPSRKAGAEEFRLAGSSHSTCSTASDLQMSSLSHLRFTRASRRPHCRPPLSVSIISPSSPRIISSVGSAVFSKRLPRYISGFCTRHYPELPASSSLWLAVFSATSSPRAIIKTPKRDKIRRVKQPGAPMKNGKDNIELSAVEDHDGILTIRGGGARRDWNGIHYKQGMSAKNVRTTKLSANVATIPPGGVAAAHIHVGFEVILYIIEGKVRNEFGPGLKQVVEHKDGDFIYIKPGVPHEVFNMSDTQPVVAFVARSSAAEWDDIIPYDPAKHNSPSKTDH